MSDEPNPPNWPDNVLIFSSDQDINDIKEKIKETEDTIEPYQIGGETKFTYTSGKHFSSDHWAILFKPGEYKDCSLPRSYNPCLLLP